MTNTFLPNAAGDLQHLISKQQDDKLNWLMAHDLTQRYNHKEWAKIIGGLAYNLIAQAWLSEKSNVHLEQEIAVLKLQAEEAQRKLLKIQVRHRAASQSRVPSSKRESKSNAQDVTRQHSRTFVSSKEVGAFPENMWHEHGHGMTPKELDKLARNIPTFTPNLAGGHDMHAYLQHIDFLLQNVANVIAWDRLYLLRITSSRDVQSFIDWSNQTTSMSTQ